MNEILPRRYQQAFIYGNFEPDINLLTHLHGFSKQKKPHGHRSGTIFPILIRMLRRDSGKPLSWGRCYRLGKCFHYAADSFTFPHNREFAGNLKAHNQYEAALHRCWRVILPQYHPHLCGTYKNVSDAQLRRRILALHQEYRSTPHHSCEQDCRYILIVTKLLLETYMIPAGTELYSGKVTKIRPISSSI